MEWLTTSTILQRLRDSDDAAWATLVARFREPIVRLAQRLGIAGDDAEDVAQETLLGLVTSLRDGTFERGKGRLRAWLFGIAHRQVQRARDRATRAGRAPELRARHAPEPSEPPEEDARLLWDDSWHKSMFRMCVHRVRQEFEPATFQAFEATALKGLGNQEAAELLGTTRNAVAVAKHRVTKRIRELLKELEDCD